MRRGGHHEYISFCKRSGCQKRHEQTHQETGTGDRRLTYKTSENAR